MLELAVSHAARLLEAPYARVWLVEGDHLRRAAAEGYLDDVGVIHDRLPLNSVSGSAALGATLNVHDAPNHPAWKDPGFGERTDLSAYLGSSIRRAGVPLGVLEVMRELDRPFSASDEPLIGALADAVAIAVGNARLVREARQSERRYRTLVEESRDPIVVTSPSGHFLDVNPAAIELLDYGSKQELLELDLVRDLYVRREDAADFVRQIHEKGFVQDMELQLKRKDGQVLTVLRTANLVRDERGEIVAYRGIMHDVTRRRNADEALRAAERRALQNDKLRALGQMAGGIAHDLNQQLGLVVGHADLALQALQRLNAEPNGSVGQALARTRDSLSVIVRAAMDGGETVRRLLAFSRADPEGPSELVDLGALLHHVAKLTAPSWRDAAQLEGRNIALSVETDTEAVVSGWPASLREAFANLVLKGSS